MTSERGDELARSESFVRMLQDEHLGGQLDAYIEEHDRLRAVEKTAAALVGEHQKHRGLTEEFFDQLYELGDALNGGKT